MPSIFLEKIVYTNIDKKKCKLIVHCHSFCILLNHFTIDPTSIVYITYFIECQYKEHIHYSNMLHYSDRAYQK
jgi:hypothetical protein